MATYRQPTQPEGQIHQLSKKRRGIFSGRALNYGFIGVDSYLRIREGESVPVAVGKAVLTNAAFSLIPGGLPVALTGMAILSTPDIINALDQGRRRLNEKKQQFGGRFTPTYSQQALLDQGYYQASMARQHLARQMANHARHHFKSY